MSAIQVTSPHAYMTPVPSHAHQLECGSCTVAITYEWRPSVTQFGSAYNSADLFRRPDQGVAGQLEHVLMPPGMCPPGFVGV